MNDSEMLELVRARMTEIESGKNGESSRPGAGPDAVGTKLAADTRKKAESKHKSAAERLDFMQRELAKAVCMEHNSSC